VLAVLVGVGEKGKVYNICYIRSAVMNRTRALILAIIGLALAVSAVHYSQTNTPRQLEGVEIREYNGQRLSSITAFRENSIKGPQHIGNQSYRLKITGLVDEARELTYEEVITQYPLYEKVVTLYCVEGWDVTILWEGVLLKDLVPEGTVDPQARTIIFSAYDGYSTSLPLDYLLENDILLAYKMNGVVLPPERGFPFQLVAESKLGYKWIKWVTHLEVSEDEDYRGFWESRGYSNDATVP
jgi:DMSO/TMAO reductase YedYZ molybdopterin-dependent catalytic subunit